MNFQTPSEDGYSAGSRHPNIASYLEHNAPGSLRQLTAGSFSYSLTRPVANKKYFYDIFDTSAKVNCLIEGWHTEGGPGVYEAVCQDYKSIRIPLTYPGTESMRGQRDGGPGSSFQVRTLYTSLHTHLTTADSSPSPSAPNTASRPASWRSPSTDSQDTQDTSTSR